jgi:hypothetical protein
MKNIIGRFVAIFGVVLELIIFITVVCAVILICISSDILHYVANNIYNPVFWLCYLFNAVSIVYSLVLTIYVMIKMMKGNLSKGIFSQLIGIFPFILGSGIVTFGFINLGSYFSLYLILFILYCIAPGLISLGSLLSTK